MKALALLILAPLASAIDYTYDSGGQLVAETFSDGSHTFYKYDSTGNPLSTISIPPSPNPQADLEITAASTPASPITGQTVTFTLTISNNGPDPATRVTVTDTLPSGFIINRVSSSQGQALAEGGNLNTNLGTLANGATATITLEGTATGPVTLALTPTVTTSEDNSTGNNSTTATSVFEPDPTTDLSLAFSVGPKPSYLPGKIFLQAIVSNDGSTTAESVTLTIPLIGTTTFNSSNVAATATATEITVPLDDLPPGSSTRILVTLNPPDNPADLTIPATVTTTSTDSFPDNNQDSGSLSIQNGTLVVTNDNDTGPGSFRQAIIDANNSATADIITFDIPGGIIPSIPLVSPLERLAPNLVIDGFSQPEGRVELDSSGLDSAFVDAATLQIGGNNLTIRGLVLNGAEDVAGISVETLSLAGENADFHENIAIEGCYIGTDTSGTIAVPNGNDGIRLFNVFDITIGGPEFWQRNLISGNERSGIDVSSSADGEIRIINNYLGTDITGTQDLGNQRSGIESNAPDTFILNNLISGNDSFGLTVEESGTFVQGNKIGTTADGTTALPNTLQGLLGSFDSNNNVLIGGIHEGEGNLISGNNRTNVELTDDGFTLAGNFIGVDITGTVGLGSNDFNADGVDLDADGPNFVGLPVKGGGNVISGNRSKGIQIESHDDHIIQNNLIGTSADGLTAIPNSNSGIAITGGERNRIGGPNHFEGNIISGNALSGIFIETSSAADTVIQGNVIGLNLAGAPLPNGGSGISNFRPLRTLIGGTEPNEGNIIAHNEARGVLISIGTAAILGNSIHSNSELGIDLGFGTSAIAPNDEGDADTGPNSLQNFPIITTIGNSVTGTLNSGANKTYRIEFFANNTADPSGNGEGETFLGSLETTTDGNGDTSFTFTPDTPLVAGQFITATATNPDNETSEFGLALIVTVPSGFNDADGDGMSDEYELEHFGTTTAGDPDADDDNDGNNNLAEFLALTDPKDASSFLTISIHIDGNDNAIISVLSKSGRTYQLHANNDLQNLQPLGASLPGNDDILEFIDSTGTRRFYQITVTR